MCHKATLGTFHSTLFATMVGCTATDEFHTRTPRGGDNRGVGNCGVGIGGGVEDGGVERIYKLSANKIRSCD